MRASPVSIIGGYTMIGTGRTLALFLLTLSIAIPTTAQDPPNGYTHIRTADASLSHAE
jgi:hypothetical protein